MTILAGLHRLVWNYYGVVLSRQPQRDMQEFAGPQFAILVRECALELDGAGGGIHRVIDKGEDPRFVLRIIVLRGGMHRELALRPCIS